MSCTIALWLSLGPAKLPQLAQVLDLLNPATASGPGGAHRGLKLRWSAAREFYCDNLFVEEAADAEQALALFEGGVQHKRMAETRMNAASSRSHCMFSLSVQVEDPADAAAFTQEGRLTLVDLAGSERQSALLDAQVGVPHVQLPQRSSA